MTTFLLVRHAETDAIGKLISGWTPGWRLNQRGRIQAERLAERLSVLPLHAVYTSPLERTVETAEFIARRHGLSPGILDRLGEVHFGAWESLSFADLNRDPLWRQFNISRGRTRPPQGELMIEVQARVVDEIEIIRRRHEDQVVAVVSHGDPLRSAIAHYLGIPIDWMVRFEISLASVSVVQCSANDYRVLQINRTEEIVI